jgi:CheY-like chemotaxis protein
MERVLVVDDNIIDARAVSNKLKSEGCEIFAGAGWAAAVGMAQTKLDLYLSGRDISTRCCA